MQISQRKLFHKQINPSEECRTREKNSTGKLKESEKGNDRKEKLFPFFPPLFFMRETLNHMPLDTFRNDLTVHVAYRELQELH